MPCLPPTRRLNIDRCINQGTKFGTVKKPVFSFFDAIILWFDGKMEQSI